MGFLSPVQEKKRKKDVTARFFPGPALGWAGLNFLFQYFFHLAPLCYPCYFSVVVFQLHNDVYSVIIGFVFVLWCVCLVIVIKIGQPVRWHIIVIVIKNRPTCAVVQHSMDNVVACVGVIIVWCGSLSINKIHGEFHFSCNCLQLYMACMPHRPLNHTLPDWLNPISA